LGGGGGMSVLLVGAILVRALLAQTEPDRTDSLPPDLPQCRYHLTARPWAPLEIPPGRYLDRIEGECRFWARHQDPSGAIIDPFIHREWQYSTPYYAYAVGILAKAGRAKDLLPSGVLAMEHACRSFAAGKADGHNEFFVPPLTEALALYAPIVPVDRTESWRTRLATPYKPGGTNNWRTYVLKGDWLRAQAGLLEKGFVTDEIERDWAGSQKKRIETTRWNLYHDTSSDPDSLCVEAVGRGNLLALLMHGYDGPSAEAIRGAVERGTAMTLLLQDPSGQAPTNGRTDDHVWVDVGYQLAFEGMAELARSRNDSWRAGQYRHAAELAFRNIERWRRTDPQWAGSFFVTKNRFDPSRRVGYQTASQYSNYNGSILYHTAEATQVLKSEIPEHPAPVEIGGYAFATDDSFAAAFANAGGMAAQINLRGATKLVYDHYWTALGIVRLGRTGWETRLGPSGGVRDSASGQGVSFAPTWEEDGTWVRLSSVPERYQGTFQTRFAHPLLVRCSVTWSPCAGGKGPRFQQELTVTPDGVLSEVTRTGGTEPWGMTVPLLSSDGASTLVQTVAPAERRASVSFPGSPDAQNFIVLGPGPVSMTVEPALETSYGNLSPVRIVTSDPCQRIWIYPSSAGDPDPKAVRNSFLLTPQGFRSCLGRVDGTLYVGRTSAGGMGTGIAVQEDGSPDAAFNSRCGFILQLDHGRVSSVETDRAVNSTVQGMELELSPYCPRLLNRR
jgi:hypothetical protein